MSKLSSRVAITFAILAGTTFMQGAPALADGADTLVNTIDGVIGTNTCTISAEQPARSGGFINGHGEVSCTRQAGFVSVEVCIETSATGAANSWVPAGQCGHNGSTNVSRRETSGSAPCAPQAMYYRTRAICIAISPKWRCEGRPHDLQSLHRQGLPGHRLILCMERPALRVRPRVSVRISADGPGSVRIGP